MNEKRQTKKKEKNMIKPTGKRSKQKIKREYDAQRTVNK